MNVRVRECVLMCEQKNARERKGDTVCVCMCKRERERVRERERERERKTVHGF